MVRAEDLGVALDEKSDYLWVTYEMTPMGERWEVENHHWDLDRVVSGCETFVCPFLWQAELAESQMLAEIQWWSDSLNRESVSSYLILVAPPQVDMKQIALDWADSAWYGENENASVLVVRVGSQVTRLSAPMALLTEELLPIIERRLAQ